MGAPIVQGKSYQHLEARCFLRELTKSEALSDGCLAWIRTMTK